MMKRLFVFLLLSAVLAAACPSAGADNFTPVCTIPTVELFNAGGLTITAGGTVLINKRIISIPVTVVNNTEKTLNINLSNYQCLNGHCTENAAIYCSMLKPGTTSQADISLERSVLEAVGVTSLEQIASLEANVYNFDTVLGTLPLSSCRGHRSSGLEIFSRIQRNRIVDGTAQASTAATYSGTFLI